MYSIAQYERLKALLKEQRKLIRTSPEYGKQLFEDLGISDLFVEKPSSPKKKVKKKR